MDSSIKHVSDHPCEPSFSSALSISPLSLLHAYPYSKISETLSDSLTAEHASESLSLMPQKKGTSDAPVTSPPKNECEPTVFQLPTQMWLDLVIKFMNFFFSLCDFFAKDHPFVSFIALKIIYFFRCFFLFFFIFFIFFIFKSDSFVVECFWDFYNGYEGQYQ